MVGQSEPQETHGGIECDGGPYCMAPKHVHGCFADYGHCNEPDEHAAVPVSPGGGDAEALEARAAALVEYGNSLPDGVTTEAFAEAENLRREARRIRDGAVSPGGGTPA